MSIAIIGAGFAGLSAAKVLRQFGHEVTVFERTEDVGGVWSHSRRYPGVRTQNDKGTYCFSDFPMPADYPEWPSGAQVQQYLEDYVRHFGIGDALRLHTEVEQATPVADGWELTSTDLADGSSNLDRFSHLVVANGIFCEPLIPPFAGAREFTDAGGRVLHTSELNELEDARGRHVLIVGYGKSSCDVADAISDASASTRIVARELLWKMPRRLGGALNYKYLMLTRMGEGLFRYLRPRGAERFLHGPGDPIRRSMLGSVQALSTWQLRLKRFGLVPDGSFEDIARSTVSLATDGLYDKLSRGEIDIHRDCQIARLSVVDGRPSAELTSGEVVPADLVVCGTGFRQSVPFFSEELQEALGDGRGNFELFRQILPLDVPNLTFSGYNSSFFSPLSAEVAALWIANLLMGAMTVAPKAQLRSQVDARLRWMEERTEGKHARGTNIIPFSMHNVDEMLEDIGIDVSALTRARQWLTPVDPTSYAHVTTELLERQRKGVARQVEAQPEPTAA